MFSRSIKVMQVNAKGTYNPGFRMYHSQRITFQVEPKMEKVKPALKESPPKKDYEIPLDEDPYELVHPSAKKEIVRRRSPLPEKKSL